jgi:hypothetical protein
MRLFAAAATTSLADSAPPGWAGAAAPSVPGSGVDGALAGALASCQGINTLASGLAARSACYALRNAVGEFASTALRDLTKDARDLMKDEGEAGHKG